MILSFVVTLSFIAAPPTEEFQASGVNLARRYQPPAGAEKWKSSQYVWAYKSTNEIKSKNEFFRMATTRFAVNEISRLQNEGNWNASSAAALKVRVLDLSDRFKRERGLIENLNNYDARGLEVTKYLKILPPEIRDAYRQFLPASTERKIKELPIAALGIIKDIPGAAAFPQLAEIGFDISASIDRHTNGRVERLNALDNHFQVERSFDNEALDIYSKAWNLGVEDKNAEEVIATANFGALSYKPTATVAEMTGTDVTTAEAAQTREEVVRAESDATSTPQTKKKARDRAKSLEQKLMDRLEELKNQPKATPEEIKAIDESLNELREAILKLNGNEELRLQREALQQQLAHQLQQRQELIQKELAQIEDVQISFQILGSIGSIVRDPEVQRALQLSSNVGSIMTNVYQKVSLFELDPGRISSIALTGDLIGAAISLISLFGDSPTPEQVILEQVQALRQDIQTLRKEMHERFDQVDRKLDAIYAKLEQVLTTVQKNHQDAMGQMASLKHEIDSYFADFRVILDQGFSTLNFADLQKARFECIESLDLMSVVMTDEKFSECSRVFLEYALQKSYDDINSPPVPDDILNSPELLNTRLQLPLSKNLNLLDALAKVKFNPIEFGGAGKLPNPDIWLIASHSLLEILMLWPEHGKRLVKPEALNRLIGVGQQIEDFRKKLRAYAYKTSGIYQDEGLLKTRFGDEANEFRRSQKLIHSDPASDLEVRLPLFYSSKKELLQDLSWPTKVLPQLAQGPTLIACNPGSIPAGEQWRVPSVAVINRAFQFAPNWLKNALYLNIVKLTLCAEAIDVTRDFVRQGGNMEGTFRARLLVTVKGDKGEDLTESIAEASIEQMVFAGNSPAHLAVWARVNWQENPHTMWVEQIFNNFEVTHLSTPSEIFQDSVLNRANEILESHRVAFVTELGRRLIQKTTSPETADFFLRLDTTRELLLKYFAFTFPTTFFENDQWQGAFFGRESFFKTSEDFVGIMLEWLKSRDQKRNDYQFNLPSLPSSGARLPGSMTFFTRNLLQLSQTQSMITKLEFLRGFYFIQK